MVYDKAFILARIEVDPVSGCWNWKLSKNKQGYALISKRSGFSAAHRVAYQLWFGPPGNLCCCHRCDNPQCVNPNHLFLGTRVENMRDAFVKGRFKKGEDKPQAKLSEADVREIRSSTATLKSLAVEFGVSDSLIYLVRTRRQWRHIL